MKTGISYHPTIPGLVPEIEIHHAARHSGYTWREWETLRRDQQVTGVAVYRLDRLVDLHANDAVTRRADYRRMMAHAGSNARGR